MQFNQCGPFPQWNSYGSFNAFIPPQQPCNPTPEIIGEGEVVSTVNLDGSIQFYFVPVLSYPCGYRSMTAPCGNPLAAWLIKSVANPTAAQPMNQRGLPLPRCPAIPQIPSTFLPDINARPSYQLKFHNDGCSSTSDLHYFCPNLRACWWAPPAPAPPPPAQPPQPPVTWPDICPARPNVQPPPPECMCVDRQANADKQESEKTTSLNVYPGLCIGSCKKQAQDTSSNKEKGVRITSSKSSSASLRSLLKKVKRKTKKRNDKTKRGDQSSKGIEVCCSRCECTRQATKRKGEEKKPRDTPSTSSGSWIWCKRKKKKEEKAETKEIPPDDKNKGDKKPDPSHSTSSRLCLNSCKIKKKTEDRGETAKTLQDSEEKKGETSSNNADSIKSFIDKIKSSLSSLYCTPNSCNRKKHKSAESAKSSKSDQIQTKQTPKSSAVSLKGILTNICSKCKKKKDSMIEDRQNRNKSPSSVHLLYNNGSKSSERSMAFDPSQSSSRSSLVHCGCDICIHCTCNQKASDCQSKDKGKKDENGANHCTCHGSNDKQIAADCKCVKEVPKVVTESCTCKKGSKKLFCDCEKEKPKSQTKCKCQDCKEGQGKKWLCECDKDETKVQMAIDCKCPDNQRAFDCECDKDETKVQIARDCKCPDNQRAFDCECDKGETKVQIARDCKCPDNQRAFDCECDKGETKVQIARDCKCPDEQRAFDCKCPSKVSNDNPCPCGCDRDKSKCEKICKRKKFIEKKQSTLKALKLTQSANGDKRKRKYYVCGCDEDGKDLTNCDDQCKFKSSAKEVYEKKRKYFVCGCEEDGKDETNCDKQCKFKSSLQGVIENKRSNCRCIVLNDSKSGNNCKCSINNNSKKLSKFNSDSDSNKKCSIALQQRADDIPQGRVNDHQIIRNIGTDCKVKCNITLREALSEDRSEEDVMVIEPSNSQLRDSESVLVTSASSDFCECWPSRCKYRGTPDSMCSCDSEVE